MMRRTLCRSICKLTLKNFPRGILTIYLAAVASQVCDAQVVLFRDDFEGELAADWTSGENEDARGFREVLDGRYLFTPDPNNPGAVFATFPNMPQDLSIRTSFQLSSKPEGDWVFLWASARELPDGGAGPAVWGGMATDGRHGIGSDHRGLLDVLNHDYDLVNTEVAVQFDLVGENLFFTTWEFGTERPGGPQFIATDNVAADEYVFLGYNARGSTNGPTASFGYYEVVGFSACNLNKDTPCDVTDVDELVGSGNLADGFNVRVGSIVRYDLDQDGTVDTLDLEKWLSDAAIENGLSEPYRLGDTNLDGVVNATDLNALALNWQRTDASRYSQGDLNGDGKVNSSDLNDLALNWQSTAATAPVPEPVFSQTILLWGIGLVALVSRRRS